MIMNETEVQMCLLHPLFHEAATLCQQIDRLERNIHIATDDEHLFENIFHRTTEEQEAILFLSKLMRYSDKLDQNVLPQLEYEVCLDDTMKGHFTTVERRHDYLVHQLNKRQHWKVRADRFRVEVAMECVNILRTPSLDSLLDDSSVHEAEMELADEIPTMCPQSPTPTVSLTTVQHYLAGDTQAVVSPEGNQVVDDDDDGEILQVWIPNHVVPEVNNVPDDDDGEILQVWIPNQVDESDHHSHLTADRGEPLMHPTAQTSPPSDLNVNKDIQMCLLHPHFPEAVTLYREIDCLEYDILMGTDDEYLAESILHKSNQERESMQFLERLMPYSYKVNQNIALQLDYDVCLDHIMKGHFKTVKRRHDYLVDQLNRRPQWKVQADRFRAEAAMECMTIMREPSLDCMNIMRAPSTDSLVGDDSFFQEAEMELFDEPIMCPPSPTVFFNDEFPLHQDHAGDAQAVVSPEPW